MPPPPPGALRLQDLVKALSGKDPNVTVNPDEVVALGAAVQVGGGELGRGGSGEGTGGTIICQ